MFRTSRLSLVLLLLLVLGLTACSAALTEGHFQVHVLTAHDAPFSQA